MGVKAACYAEQDGATELACPVGGSTYAMGLVIFIYIYIKLYYIHIIYIPFGSQTWILKITTF